MKVQKINSQVSNKHNHQKTNMQPAFKAVLRVYDSSNLLTNKQKDILWEKARKVNCDWLYAWLEASDIPIEVQVVKGNNRSHVELLDDVMPSVKGKETFKLNPFDAMSGWIDMLLVKHK